MPSTSVTDWLIPDSVQESADKFVFLVNALILFLIATSILSIGLVLTFNRQIFGIASGVVGGKVGAVANVAKAVTKK